MKIPMSISQSISICFSKPLSILVFSSLTWHLEKLRWQASPRFGDANRSSFRCSSISSDPVESWPGSTDKALIRAGLSSSIKSVLSSEPCDRSNLTQSKSVKAQMFQSKDDRIAISSSLASLWAARFSWAIALLSGTSSSITIQNPLRSRVSFSRNFIAKDRLARAIRRKGSEESLLTLPSEIAVARWAAR